MKKVVFLDYDGVVNRKMWTKSDGKWVCQYGYPEDGMVNDEQAVQWVSEFCEKCGFDIVVTSTWRKYPEWEKCLRNAGLRDGVNILGTTALPTKDRADEISDYLAAHSDIEYYLIFDDDASLLEDTRVTGAEVLFLEEAKGKHADNLILCCKEHGFGEKEYKLAAATYLNWKYEKHKQVKTVPTIGENGLLGAVVELLYQQGNLRVSVLQRTFKIGYGKAVNLIDILCDKDIIMMSDQRGGIEYLPIVEKEEAQARLKEQN